MTAIYYYSTETFSRNKLLSLLYIIAGSLFIALMAQIRIPLPFTPIPITMQTLAVMLVGITLGPQLGMLSLLAYFAEISLGLPFLPGGASNPAILFSLKGGYYLGFSIQAYIAGKVIENKEAKGQLKLFTGLVLAITMPLVCGGVWLSYFLGWRDTLLLGIFPFIPGEILKVMAVMGYLVYRDAK